MESLHSGTDMHSQKKLGINNVSKIYFPNVHANASHIKEDNYAIDKMTGPNVCPDLEVNGSL